MRVYLKYKHYRKKWSGTVFKWYWGLNEAINLLGKTIILLHAAAVHVYLGYNMAYPRL